MYYYTKVLSDLFLDTPYPDTKNTFRGSTQVMDFWRVSGQGACWAGAAAEGRGSFGCDDVMILIILNAMVKLLLSSQLALLLYDKCY